MKKLLITTTLLLTLLQYADAQVLATRDVSGGAGINSVQNALDFTIGNMPVSLLFSNSVELQVNATDVGKTLTILPSQDPAFFANLTNGESDRIAFQYVTPVGGGGGFSLPEATFFTSYPAQWNGIDFQGYEINSLSLTINSLTFNSPGSNPNGNGEWTDYTFDATLAVNGQAVPEPSSFLFGIMTVGLFGCFSIGRRRNWPSIYPRRA